MPANVFSNKCKFCPDTTEDEDHFIFQCPVYVDIRRKYLHTIIDDQAVVSINNLFEIDSIETSRKVAMYIYYAMRLRDELLDAMVNV